MIDDIFSTALAMSGTLVAQQQDVLNMLCLAAQAEFSSRLRPGIAAEDCRENFVAAAAILAVSAFHCVHKDEMASFNAGSISLTLREADSSALAVLAKRMLAPWCSDEGFSFRGVRA
ncbi:MAG: hypothetical protein LBM28_01250 [Oscillospiraceae bacterium]|nr:hypothetical protein [Oscillospiraceae bacterium]